MSEAAALPVPFRGVAGGTLITQARGFVAQPAVARALPLMGLMGLVAAAFLAWSSLTTPPQRDLFQNLADTDKAAVADTLRTAGIDYRIDGDTGGLSVATADYYQAKMLLAQAGLPKAAPDGDSMITSLPMGASRAVEGERLRSAREADLARTIEAIDAVASAKVHLAIEPPSVFLRDPSPAAASVMLKLRAGRALGDGQVQAIVNLVASSVPGLAPDGVSVVDQSGRLLSRRGGESAAADRQLEIQGEVEQRYKDAVVKLLSPLVGSDAFTAEVHADLDFAEVQATRETYPKDTAVIRQEQGGWNNDAAKGGEAGGIPGALSNQAPPAAAVAAAPNQTLTPPIPGAPGATATGTQGKTSETYNRSYDIGREVSVTKQPVGTVKRISVAVALKEDGRPRGQAELAGLERLVKGAVGFDQARGDQFALTSRKFVAAEPAEAPAWYEAEWLWPAVRAAAAVVIALLMVLFVGKPLLKKRAAAQALPAPAAPVKPSIRGEIAAALANEARNDPAKPVTLDMIEAAPGYADRAALIRNFVRQDPDRAALVVRDLIRTDMPEKANG